MRFLFRNYFFALALFLLPGLISAQVRRQPLHVVKDNIACTYGLKNDSGQWVVPAQYTKITTTNNWINFIVTSGEKSGVIDKEGKTVLPVLYDHITTIGYPKAIGFTLSLNGKYGVLDSVGKPVIPFEYDAMTFMWRYKSPLYIIQKNAQWGIVDQTNHLLLPIEYAEITVDEHGYGYFLKKKRDKNNPVNYRNEFVGYGDSSGIVISCMYREIKDAYDYYNPDLTKLFIVTDSSSRMNRGVVNNKNEIIIPLVYNDVWSSVIAYPQEKKEERFVVETSEGYGTELYGVFDFHGNKIIDPGTRLICSYSNRFSDHFAFNSTDTLPAKQNQKWGLLTGNNVWVTSQEYDSIILPEYVPHAPELRWIVLKNKKYGTLSANGKIFIPVEYDVLREINDNDGRNTNSYAYINDNTYYFIGKKNGKSGMTDNKGKEWVPYIYDTILDFGSDFYFTNKTEAVYFKRAESNNYGRSISAEAFPLKYYFKISDSLLVYKSKYSYYAFEDSTTKGKLLLITPLAIYNDNENEKLIDAIVCHEGYSRWYAKEEICDTLTFDKTGKPVVNPLKGIEIANYYNDNIIFRSKEKKLGIISKNGKILVPAIYDGFQPVDYDNRSYLWIKFQADSSCPFYKDQYNDCPCGWTLCDSLRKPVCKTLFDYPFLFVSDLEPVYVNGKAGLFDVKTKRFLIPPLYSDMISIYGNPYENYYNSPVYDYNQNEKKLFYVIRDNGEFGIVDSTGKWVSDSTFTEMIPVPRRNNLLCAGGKTELFAANRQLITGNSVRMIMDENGVMTKDSALIDSLLMQTFIMSDFHYGYYSVGDGGGGNNTPAFMKKGPCVTANFYSKKMELYNWKDSLAGKAMIYSQALLMNKYKYMFVGDNPRSYYFKCMCTTTKRNPDWRNYDQINLSYTDDPKHRRFYDINNYLWESEITYLAPQGFTLMMPFNPDSSKAAKNNAGPFYLNFRKTATGFVPCTLDSIFCSDVNYAFVLNKLILKAISKRDDLNLDCNNPASYFLLSHGRFCFTKDGLKFFIENNNKAYGGSFEITIPWEEIQPYSRPGGIVDDFIGNSSGEHCKLPLDTTAIDFKFQKYFRVNDFANSNFLKSEKVKSCSYFLEGDKFIGMRFCCEGNVVYDVYFKETKTPGVKQTVQDNSNLGLNNIPKKVRKRKITKMICIRNFPC
jgi:hypothetical protein